MLPLNFLCILKKHEKKVFLYEDSNENFKKAVNEITMELQQKYSEFEINSREITYSNQINKENGKKCLKKNLTLKFLQFLFLIQFSLQNSRERQQFVNSN